MASNVKLLLIEMLSPPYLQLSPVLLQQVMTDLQMWIMTGGGERTVPEYQSLLASAGVELTKIIPTPGLDSINEARLR